MREGLKIIQVMGSYYSRSITLVGWMKRRNGDEWDLLPGARVIRCTGNRRGLGWLAENGLGDDYQFILEPSESLEEMHRLLVRRSLVANEANWVRYGMVRPKDWHIIAPALDGKP